MSRIQDMGQDLPVGQKVQGKFALTFQDIKTEDGLFLLSCFAKDGMNTEEMAKMCGVHPQTLRNWIKKDEDVRRAVQVGSIQADYQVEDALFRAAVGYKTKKVKTVIMGEPDKEGNRIVKVEKTELEYGPNVTACLAWLNNRRPDRWKRNTDQLQTDEEKYKGVTINIVKGEKAEDNEYGLA